LVCDIAYESLLTPRRQKLHHCIAEALEALPGNLAEHEPESLAHHWFAASQNDPAEPYWLRTRHRMARCQEQLDAGGLPGVQCRRGGPVPRRAGVHKLH
jgi:hypothetical protein